ncbi:hypothetical protein BU17DRAFT_86497 [Hysterangium stoloniferum]|nr:hypothetical protein BU17DRAFT_86496 [Hysterangium stoloniferum]KAF8522930.1 hypothetical protein BU17DRAFT_86497 [Hysterangium stoloniferum]
MKITLLSLVAILCAPSVFAIPSPEANTIYTVNTKKSALHERVVETVNADALKCRTCPKTSCTAVRQYPDGAQINVRCKTDSNTTPVNGWPWWDLTSDGCWVSDEFVSWTGGVPPNC